MSPVTSMGLGSVWMMAETVAKRIGATSSLFGPQVRLSCPGETALGVRRRPADPWLNIAVLLDDLLEVRSIVIRYRARDGEARARLSVAGLGGAISWCMRAFDSNRARTLPRPIRR